VKSCEVDFRHVYSDMESIDLNSWDGKNHCVIANEARAAFAQSNLP
jgi:hypothetical protein